MHSLSSHLNQSKVLSFKADTSIEKSNHNDLVDARIYSEGSQRICRWVFSKFYDTEVLDRLADKQSVIDLLACDSVDLFLTACNRLALRYNLRRKDRSTGVMLFRNELDVYADYF